MVIYLGLLNADPVSGQLNPPLSTGGLGHVDPADPTGPRLAHFYTCRHLDAATGDCTDYDNRPRLCREYPYGVDCEKRDCTWTSAKYETRHSTLGRASLPIVIDEPPRSSEA